MSTPEIVLAGGGEMGALMRQIDWATTPVGAVCTWPQSLRTAVGILLDSKFGMYIAWGAGFTQFYNDAYRPILGSTKHPSFGRSSREVFPEIWPTIGPLFDGVMQGRGVGFDDLMLALDRHGYLEECFFTFSYSPIRDETGVGGVLVTVTETTARVLGERRLRVLRDLAAAAAHVQDETAAWAKAAEILRAAGADLPFTLVYRSDAQGSRLRRVDDAPVPPSVAPAEIDLSAAGASPWPFAAVLASAEPDLVTDVRERRGDHVGPSWPESVAQALVLPIMRPGFPRPFGVLIAAISPRRALDDDYRAFLVLAAREVAVAIASARAFEEERLQVRELRSLIRNVPGAVFRCEANAPWRFHYMSEPVEELTGYPASDYLVGGKDWASLIHPEDLELVEQGASAAAAERHPHNLEYRIKRADGAVRWVVDRGRAIYDRAGAIEAWDGVVFDITERKEADARHLREKQLESAAREGAERFRFIAETMVQKVFTAKASGEVDYFNRPWMELTGLSFEQIRDWGWTQFIHPDDLDETTRRWRHSLATGEPFELENRYRSAAGPYRWHLSRAQPVRDADGTITMWLGSNTDIDDVKRAEESVRQSERDLYALFMQAPAAICVLKGPEHVFEMANQQYLMVVGRTADILGQPLLTAIPEARDQGYEELLRGVMSRNEPFIGRDMPLKIDRRGDGVLEDTWWTFVIAPMRNPAGVTDRVMALVHEVTEQVLAGKEREGHIQELQRTIKFSEIFVGILGHDLRNPLSAITTAANLLELRADSDQIVKPVRRIAASADRMDRMISQLLDFTQIRLGRGIPLAPAPLDLADVARAIIDELQPVHQCEIQLTRTGATSGMWDRDRLSQLMSNLVANACQHGAPGAPVMIEIDGSGEERVSLAIANRGAIPAELVPMVFEPLQSGERQQRRKGASGLGLGLYITQQIAAAHGGSIKVESTEVAGTRFIVELPRQGTGGAERVLDVGGFATDHGT